MFRKIGSIFVVIFLVLGLVAACAPKDTNEGPTTEPQDSTELELGTIDFKVIDLENTNDETLREWYDEKVQNEGIATLDEGEYKYILVSGGEKPSAGHSMEITGVEGKEDEIVVNAQLTAPSENVETAAVITYPSQVIRIAKDDRNVILGEYNVIETKVEENDEVTVIGTYVGLIDNNSCEITVDGEPNAFRISEEILNALEKVNSGEQVEFSYYKNEYDQLVITNLKKAE